MAETAPLFLSGPAMSNAAEDGHFVWGGQPEVAAHRRHCATPGAANQHNHHRRDLGGYR